MDSCVYTTDIASQRKESVCVRAKWILQFSWMEGSEFTNSQLIATDKFHCSTLHELSFFAVVSGHKFMDSYNFTIL